MTLRVAINGFGRIGRNFMRCWLSRGADTNLEIVGLNGSGDTTTNAHLLKYDSMLGPLRGVEITTTENSITVNGKTIKVFYDRNPANLPWKEWGVDLVIESTGVFNAVLKAASENGMKGIIKYCDLPLVSSDHAGTDESTIVDADLTLVMGGNMVKIVCWYDNEWGYSQRVVDLAEIVAKNWK